MTWAAVDDATGEVIGTYPTEAFAGQFSPHVEELAADLEAEVAGGGRIRWDGTALVRDVDVARARRWTEIKAEREERLRVAPVEGVGSFDSDEEGLANINGQVSDILVDGADAYAELPIRWKMHDNSYVDFASAADFIAAARAVKAYRADVYAQSWQMQAALQAAATAEEVEAVGW